jgi:integrin alpha FG-GAP repeat containing protein 1
MWNCLIIALLLTFVHNLNVRGEDKGKISKVNLALPPKGKLLAVGHYFGQRQLDALILTLDGKKLQLYEQMFDDLAKFPTYRLKPSVELELKKPVLNALIGDYNHDGRAEILLMLKDGAGVEVLMYMPDPRDPSKLIEGPKFNDALMKDQPLLVDFRGRMLVDLFGIDSKGDLSIWKANAVSYTSNTKEIFYGPVKEFTKEPLHAHEQMCIPRIPNYGIYADFNGDGIADLFLVCEKVHPQSLPAADLSEEELKRKVYYEIWMGSGRDGHPFSFGQRGELPAAPDCLIASDIDGNGSIDIVMTFGKTLYVLFNGQRNFCSDNPLLDASNCKSTKLLFNEDKEFGFDHGDRLTLQLPAAPLLKDNDGSHLMGLQACDIDADGYPDLMFVGSGGIFSSTKLYLLKNVVDINGKRKFNLVNDNEEGYRDLLSVANPISANFVQFTPDVFPDFVISTKDDELIVFRNEIFRDVFFLRVEVFNGVCTKDCRAKRELAGALSEPPYGGGYPGVSIRYHFSDFERISRVRIGTQYPQTNYRSLPMPFITFGLGRVNNFIEEIRAGVPSSTTSLRKLHVIPNSYLLIYPPNADEQHWRIQLYLNPSQYAKWVAISVLLAIVVFGLITLAFKTKEWREDKKERMRRIHEINFDAM